MTNQPGSAVDSMNMHDQPRATTPTAEWRVKYDGACSRCGIALRVGDVAVYERSTHSIRCVVCPSDSGLAQEQAFDPGVAGASARREYERRKDNRETRIRGRFGRFGGAVLALTDDPQSTRAWATGARGEEKLAKAFEGIEGLLVLHDRRVRGIRGNIDHILVAPAGVFVVDAKQYQGKIEIRNRGWFLRPDPGLYVGRRDRSSMATALGWAGGDRHDGADRGWRRSPSARDAGPLLHRWRLAAAFTAAHIRRRTPGGPQHHPQDGGRASRPRPAFDRAHCPSPQPRASIELSHSRPPRYRPRVRIRQLTT